MFERKHDVIIIGGGLQGCAIALFLARAGSKVAVIDRTIAGRHASGVNAGGLRLLLRDHREYPIAMRALEIWANLEDFVGRAGAEASEVRLQTSQVAIAMDANEMTWAMDRARDMDRRGIFNERLLDAGEIRRLLPGISSHVLGGLVSEPDGHANPANAARAFRMAAAAGAHFEENCRVVGLEGSGSGAWRVKTDRGTAEAEIIVNCAGAWGAGIARLADEMLSLEAMALSMMVTARVQHFVTPVVIGIDKPLSFKQSAAGSLVIGGGIAGKPCLDEATSFTIMDRMVSSAAATIEAFPCLSDVPVLRTWTGLEGVTPDGIPYIGPSARHPGLWHVFGFCGHGFQLSPAVGEIVATSVVSGKIDARLLPFSVDRFKAGQPVRGGRDDAA
ncbi:NAD(P)/FAD-dependent oxidoreductase [Rhizobium bangladeshense]|uniref:NAD(P)/FAD-dependent oxidoreductase n=1 Tax=Rhizobium bangladeshense TaxID=1138189 RepID=UPI0007E5A76A|nr:FAD-binding oxidoreductase [Rhizobium bangladeshense]